MQKSFIIIIFCLMVFVISAVAEPIWIYQTPGNPPISLAAIPDITGDKLPELVAGYESGLMVCFASGAKTKPEIIWKTNIAGAVLAMQPIPDVNTDGYPELVASTDRGNIVCLNAGGPTAGKILWAHQAVFNISSLVVIEDTNADGIKEIAFGGADHRVTLLNGKNGNPIWSRLFQGTDETAFVDCIANAGDLNGDNISDLFIRTWGASRWAISGIDGIDIWPPKPGSPYLSTLISAKDLNNDGIIEFLESGNIGILCMYNGKDGEEIWQSELGRPIRALAISEDITGDKIFDCYAGNAAGKIYGLSGAGQEKVRPVWTADIGDVCRTIVVLDDINQDGKPDIVAGAENGLIAAYSGANGERLWQVQGPDTVRTIVKLGDYDVDGVSDIATALLDGSIAVLSGNPKTKSVSFSAQPAKRIKSIRKHVAPSKKEIPEVPILLYHDVPPQGIMPGDSSPLQNFREQMDFLVQEGYHAVSLDEVADWIDGKRNLPSKPVCITFDGQYSSHYTHLYKILKDRGLFGASYITTDWIGTPNHLDWHELRELEQSGVMQIENHSINHPFFSAVNKEEITRQVVLSNKAINRHLLGKIVKHHAYPNGVYNTAAIEVMREQGFRTATSVQDRKGIKSDNLYRLPRYTIAENMTLITFKTLIDQSNSPYPPLDYKYVGTVGMDWRMPSYGDIDTEGKLWVCDYVAGRVRVFLPDGKEASFSPITQGMKQNGETIPIRAPSGIAVTPNGEVWVSIASRFGAIQHTGIFRYSATDGKMLPGIDLSFTPGDLDSDAQGLVYLVDKLSEQWYIYAPEGKPVLGSPFGTSTAFHIQRGISVTPDGSKVYIISESKNNVRVWEGKATPESAAYKQIENLIDNLSAQSGSVDVMDDGTVFVSCFSEGMMLAFDRHHKLIGRISGDGAPSISGPRGVAFTPDGKDLWIISMFGQVQHWKK
ncbi:MAG: polysaccharide deacetylase family protein [bacterium]